MSYLPVIVPRIKRALFNTDIIQKHPKVHAFLDHPAGPFTIHFWAPTFKWGITLANIADMRKPVDCVSVNQQCAVTLTGLIWSRYSLIIKPKNYNLLVVNMFMAGTGSYQLFRKWQARNDVVDDEDDA